jgi:hypothetical protein
MCRFRKGEVGRTPVRYGALAWTIGRGGTILSSGRGKVAQGVGIDEGGCGSGFCLAWRRERGMGGVQRGVKIRRGAGPGSDIRRRRCMPGNGAGVA